MNNTLIFIIVTQKRLESQLEDLRIRNEGLMRDKIILNGRIAALQAVIDTYKNEKEVM